MPHEKERAEETEELNEEVERIFGADFVDLLFQDAEEQGHSLSQSDTDLR